MSYILGIHKGHDASACILKDGAILAAAEEERFNRIKHSIGYPFPKLAVKFCLEYVGVSLSDIDAIAVDTSSPTSLFSAQIKQRFDPKFFKPKELAFMSYLATQNILDYYLRKDPFGLKADGIPADKIKFVEHH
ncbi:MAG: hypothetical protein JW834_01330 [Candidatus Diapherotrites archaeon]|nr:hypothetical protein [Candidatus Diapherotrites archaeon]